MGRPQTRPAERGTAAARGDRPRPRERPGDRMGRRADGEPGFRDVGADYGPLGQPEPREERDPCPRDARFDGQLSCTPRPADAERADRRRDAGGVSVAFPAATLWELLAGVAINAVLIAMRPLQSALATRNLARRKSRVLIVIA